jgi:hypothetical protein
MSRRHSAEKREINPDPKFGDLIVTKFMNLDTTRSPNFGSGLISRFSARCLRDMRSSLLVSAAARVGPVLKC